MSAISFLSMARVAMTWKTPKIFTEIQGITKNKLRNDDFLNLEPAPKF